MLNNPVNVDLVRPDPAQAEFVRSVAKLMVGWGMPQTAARIYGYLLLQPEPVGLDQIAADLGISKASAWAATKHLDQVNQVERFGEPGSKRALYAATSDVEGSLRNYSKLLRRFGDLLREGEGAAGHAVVASRMRQRSDFYLTVHEAIETTARDTMAGRKQAV